MNKLLGSDGKRRPAYPGFVPLPVFCSERRNKFSFVLLFSCWQELYLFRRLVHLKKMKNLSSSFSATSIPPSCHACFSIICQASTHQVPEDGTWPVTGYPTSQPSQSEAAPSALLEAGSVAVLTAGAEPGHHDAVNVQRDAKRISSVSLRHKLELLLKTQRDTAMVLHVFLWEQSSASVLKVSVQKSVLTL